MIALFQSFIVSDFNSWGVAPSYCIALRWSLHKPITGKHFLLSCF